MWQHIFKFKLFHVQYFNGLWTKASLSFFVIIMTMSRSAGRCQSRSNLLIAKLRVATRETSQVSLSSSSPSSLPNQSVHHRKANSLHRHCPKRRAPRPYQHQTQHQQSSRPIWGRFISQLSPSSLVSPLSGKTNGAEKQEGGSNVANVLWSSQVPPGPSPSRKSTTQNPLAAGNWLQIDILRAEHESWKYPPSKLATPNQTRHHRDYNYILVFRWFTGIDHSSAVEWLSRRFIKYSPTLQPPGVGLAIICKKREWREGLEEWPKNIAKNWETLERKNITQLRKGHR